MEALRFRRKFRLHHARQEIDAQDRADDAERIRDRIADRRLAVPHGIERRLQRGRARHRTGINAQRVTNLDAEYMAKPERDKQAGDAGDERQQIILAADAAHSFEKFASIKNPDAVEKHDQPGETDRAGDLRLRRERADGQPDEQHGADTERKAADLDLADQIADADGKKDRENGLAAEDLADGVQHEVLSGSYSRRSIGDDAVSGRCSPRHGIVRSRGW